MPKGVYPRTYVRYQFLLAYQHTPGRCSIWPHAKFPFGYGMLTVPGISSPQKAHRVSWELHNGPIPPGGHVLHYCDTPPCFNPECLFLGDNDINVADRYAKGRSACGAQVLGGSRHGENNNRTKLTEADVAEIRRLLGLGWTQGRIGLKFGLTHSAISKIATGRSWASRSPSPALPASPGGVGSQTPSQRLRTPPGVRP